MDGDDSVDALLREAKGKYATGKRKDAYNSYIRALESIVRELKDPAVTADDSGTARDSALKHISTARTCLDEAGQILRSLTTLSALGPPPAATKSAPILGINSTLPLPPLKPPRLPPTVEVPETVLSATSSGGSDESTPPTSSITGTPPNLYVGQMAQAVAFASNAAATTAVSEKPKPKPPLPPKPSGPVGRSESYTGPATAAVPADLLGPPPKPSASAPVPRPALPSRAVSASKPEGESLAPPPQPPRSEIPPTMPSRPLVPPPIIATPSSATDRNSMGSLQDSSMDEDLDVIPPRSSASSPTPISSRPRSVPGRLEGNLDAVSESASVAIRPASSYSTQQQKKPGIPKSSLVKWHSDFVQQLEQVSVDLKQMQANKSRRYSDSEALEMDSQSAYIAAGDAALSSNNYLFNGASPDPDNATVLKEMKGLKATLEFRAGRVLNLIDLARRTSLLQLKSYHVAHQLSLLEQSLFLQIKPHDLLNHHPPHNSNPAIQASTDFFNYITRVVEHSILSEPTLTNRARVIHQWAKVSQHLLQIRNVQTLRAVSAAMQTPPVARLKKTWAVVPRKSMVSIEQIRALLSEQNNYYVYREWCARGGGTNISDILGSLPTNMAVSGHGTQHSHHGTGRLPRPAVPFFGVYIQDTYYLIAALKKEGVVGPSGTLDNDTILKDKRMQEIVDQIVYYQSGGTYAPVSAGKGDLALSTTTREGSNSTLHLKEGGSLALGVLRGIGSATAHLARRSTKPNVSNNVGLAESAPVTSGGQTLPMTVVPGTIDDQLKEMDDETASMFTQHWILSREWYTEKEVDDLSVQREPKASDDDHLSVNHYAVEKVASSSVSTASTGTGVTLVDRDSMVSAYRDSTASDISYTDLLDTSGGGGGGPPGTKKTWSLKKMMKDIGGNFSSSGSRPDSMASDAIAEYGEDERATEERRRSGSDVPYETSSMTMVSATSSGHGARNSIGSAPTPRELMAQVGLQARSLAEKRGTNYESIALDLSTDSSMTGSPYQSPGNSRPTSAVSTPNNASLDDVGNSPGPLPVRSRASRSPERDLASSAGSTGEPGMLPPSSSKSSNGAGARPFSYFAPLATPATEGQAPSAAAAASFKRSYSGEAPSPVSAPTGKPPFGVRFEDTTDGGDGEDDSSSVKTHQRTHSAGRLGGQPLPPGAFGYTMSGPSAASSAAAAAAAADKSLMRRSTASPALGRDPISPNKDRPQSIAIMGSPALPPKPSISAPAAAAAAAPANNEPTVADNKRKPVKGGFALPGMAAGP